MHINLHIYTYMQKKQTAIVTTSWLWTVTNANTGLQSLRDPSLGTSTQLSASPECTRTDKWPRWKPQSNGSNTWADITAPNSNRSNHSIDYDFTNISCWIWLRVAYFAFGWFGGSLGAYGRGSSCWEHGARNRLKKTWKNQRRRWYSRMGVEDEVGEKLRKMEWNMNNKTFEEKNC